LQLRKAIPRYSELHLLSLVGQSQLGRLRYGDSPWASEIPEQSVQELASYQGTEDLLSMLFDRFARVSGVSGVQPKVLVRDSAGMDAKVTVHGATHIVKAWEPEFDQLAANEFFCMKVARRSGLSLPPMTLSDNGKLLIIERFDRDNSGHYLGFEDFCSLNLLGTSQKYEGTYERLAKRVGEFTSPEYRAASLKQFFTLIAVSCAVQNGDAHLKNFGLIYDSQQQNRRLAPAYDIVSTTPYLPQDALALTLDGSKRFPSQKQLITFAVRQCGLTPALAKQTLEQIADALHDTLPELQRYQQEHPAFQPIGSKIRQAWLTGCARSLRPGH